LTGHLAAGLGAATGAATLYGSAPVAQAVASRRTPGAGMGFGLVLRLVRQPIWLLGLGLEVAGFVLEAYAFSVAPVTLVAPVMACDILVFVLIGSTIFGSRPSGTGLSGVGAMAGGLALLALAFSSDTALGTAATSTELVGFLGGAIVLAGVAALFGTRALKAGRQPAAAGIFSMAAGFSYGLATLSTRQIGRTFGIHHPWSLLGTVTPYALVGCSVLGVILSQRASQARAIIAFPLISAAAAFLPVILGATLFGDQVPTGGLRVSFIAGLVLLASGVVLLARERSMTEVSLEHHQVGADSA
jgi:hypothetical protein